ncbi:MAG: FHA domain-containing protein [Deltaproteobacteria bacterium]|jgi:hypothetical protein|nr:FHA domain-containing protein [Deltaproteobacteria bacterium]
MRECLGWITNCPNDQGCPQNWLEFAVSELPRSVECHVCGHQVDMVVTEDELNGRPASKLAAFPAVPCTGFVAPPRAPATGANGSAIGGPSPARGIPASATAAPQRAPTPAQPVRAKTWVVTLTNGEKVKLDKEAMVIGRSRTCDVVIPSAKISRQHASLSRVDGEYYIEDLGSANGLWLNGEKVTRAKLNPGDKYSISDETLLFEER